MQKKKSLILVASGVAVAFISLLFILLLQTTNQEVEETLPAQPSSTLVTTAAVVEKDPAAVELLGMTVYKTGEKFEGTEIGGLSAITYDSDQDVYYVLSDDRGRPDDPRFYTVSIAADGSEVTFEAVTFLLDVTGKPLKANTIDPEGIAFADGQIIVSSEGDADNYPPVNPSVTLFALSGERISEFILPEKFLPDGFGKTGVRGNKAFEALTLSPDASTLTTAVENALVQDGPIATTDTESFSRLIQFDTAALQPIAEFVYITGVVPVADATGSDDNGLVELIALDNQGSYLALERSYVAGFGNTIQLYAANTNGATDVSAMDTLWDAENNAAMGFIPMEKMLITKLSDLGIDPDNVEGMALGPQLADGRRILVLVSDNNFNNSQETQFIVLALILP
ncbi:MAG: esterase-like activity of phytase family protein [Anaerolineae bacterium]|jgi:hypothetical protein|nr:esterase-like activity of phytase family protein [Anaerolineae bacterium]